MLRKSCLTAVCMLTSLLAAGLMACSSGAVTGDGDEMGGEPPVSVKIVKQDGTEEEFTDEDFEALNSQALEGYVGSYVEMTDTVSSIDANIGLFVGDCEGTIRLSNGTYVGYPEDALDLVSDLQAGDKVRVTGYVLSANNQELNVSEIESPLRFEDGTVLEEAPLTIERAN